MDGYISIYVNKKLRYEHKYKMEKLTGKKINNSTHETHHKDGNIKNNNISNLEILTKRNHKRLHNGWKLISGEWYKTCNKCNRFLKVKDNFYRRKIGLSEFASPCKDCMKTKSRNSRKYSKCKICGNKISYKGKLTTYLCSSCATKRMWKRKKGGYYN